MKLGYNLETFEKYRELQKKQVAKEDPVQAYEGMRPRLVHAGQFDLPSPTIPPKITEAALQRDRSIAIAAKEESNRIPAELQQYSCAEADRPERNKLLKQYWSHKSGQNE